MSDVWICGDLVSRKGKRLEGGVEVSDAILGEQTDEV